MNLTIKKSKIRGCYELLPEVHVDARGAFIKTYHKEIFERYHLKTDFSEEYYSISRKGVLRGMHFQIPPHDHVKVVYCVFGEVMDVIVDIRANSPTYGQFDMFTLNAEDRNMLYIPEGLAHGFYVVSDKAVLMYKVTTVYSPEHDTGILWNSVGIPWMDNHPLVSERDNKFQRFEGFVSPFQYEAEKYD